MGVMMLTRVGFHEKKVKVSLAWKFIGDFKLDLKRAKNIYCGIRLRRQKFFCRFVHLKTCCFVHLKKIFTKNALKNRARETNVRNT